MHSRPSADSRPVADRRSKVRETRGRYLRRGQAFFRKRRWRFVTAKAEGTLRPVGDKCLDFAERLLPLPARPAARRRDRRAPASLPPKKFARQPYRFRWRPTWRKASARSEPDNRLGSNMKLTGGEIDLPMVAA